MEHVARPNGGVAGQMDVGSHTALRTHAHVRIDDRVGADLDRGIHYRLRINNSRWMYHGFAARHEACSTITSGAWTPVIGAQAFRRQHWHSLQHGVGKMSRGMMAPGGSVSI